MMKIKRIDLFSAALPFRFSFRHAAGQRHVSESIFVKLQLENGVVGWGEALPRAYVTGETVDSALGALRKSLAPLAAGRSVETQQDAFELAEKISAVPLEGETTGGVYFGAAHCALETALLDAASRVLEIPLMQWLRPVSPRPLFATAVVPQTSLKNLQCLLWLIKLTGFKAVKVKVGSDAVQDYRALSLVRGILGDRIPLLVDANGAWQARTAIQNLRDWKKFNIRAVEQPVAAGDVEGMRRVREQTGLDVMADESLRSLSDAARLVAAKACTMFNIRLSKCGGMLSAWKILRLAQNEGIVCQLGCQVGESSLLAAAGRCFACAAEGLEFYVGGYGWMLLQKDPARPRVSLGWRGRVSGRGWDKQPGLGICVDESLLKPYGVVE